MIKADNILYEFSIEKGNFVLLLLHDVGNLQKQFYPREKVYHCLLIGDS